MGNRAGELPGALLPEAAARRFATKGNDYRPQRLDPDVVAQAAGWMARLQAGADSDLDAEREACEQWRQAAPAHEEAWQRMSSLGNSLRSGLDQVPPAIARVALRTASPVSRRSALKSIVGLGIVAGGAWATADQLPIDGLMADYRTGVGDRRTITLEDGSRIILNASSAINVSIDAAQRTIRFLQGEMLVIGNIGHTGHAPGSPLLVATRHGNIAPMGTRFAVADAPGGPGTRRRDAPIAVSALDGAVRIAPHGQRIPSTLDAGQRAEFMPTSISTPEPVGPDAGSWVDGMLVADRMPLPRFLAALARYRHGVLRADPALAGLSISGSFPLDNSDAVLDILQDALPVRVRTVTRYWVSVLPA
ncbi:FecR domain-containing protein [Cupriavidus sp. 30B13]|uniref:FecR domain-containing protein n=1 Tax=Cupriavidus sp. 30B13 TaxID=3384241 RepID=UPI003B90E114